MQNFDYKNPTHIVFGQDRMVELDSLIPETAKVMICFGGGSAKRFGTIEAVRDALKGRDIVEFGGIEPNPEFTTLVKAADIARAEKVDFLLAVGGGSVMDGTKFIALASCCEKTAQADILSHGFMPANNDEALPLGCVVTLPATGSEMNMGGVVTKDGVKQVFKSPLCFPTFSILDPDLLLSLPKEQVANGVADAFVHVVEQYLTKPIAAKVQDRLAEGVMMTLVEDGPIVYEDIQDLSARQNFMWSATVALNGWIGVGMIQDWSTHMIGHQITAQFGIAHGRSLAIILPSLLRERSVQKRDKLVQFAERVWGIHSGTVDERIEAAIVKTEAFFNSLGIVTKLSHYGIDTDGIKSIKTALEEQGLVSLSETRDLTPDIAERILINAL